MTRYFELIKEYPGSESLGTVFEKEHYSDTYNLHYTYLISIKKEYVENNAEFFKEVMLDNLPSQIFNWEKLEFKEHKYIMGVDFSSDNDVNSYTLARVVDGVIEFLAIKSTTDETFFESEVKILTDLFNADIIKLNKK